MSSGIELAKAIPAIEEQPLTYHLMFPVSDGVGMVLETMTNEEISTHSSYQLDSIPSELKHVRLAMVLYVLVNYDVILSSTD